MVSPKTVSEISANELSLIADQLERVYKGPSWLGPDLKSLLSKVNEERAARRPIPQAHSIWEITLHISRLAEGWARASQREAMKWTRQT